LEIFQTIKIKVEQVVICKLTPLLTELYNLFVKSNLIDDLDEKTTSSSGVGKDTLSAITAMKKLCNRNLKNFIITYILNITFHILIKL